MHHRPPPPAPVADVLIQQMQAAITPAERRVLTLVCRGESNQSIATLLMLSPRTVESHVSRLLSKTGCRNRTQLTLWNQANMHLP
jgi:DNA-binding NarL/FixJ family response regulator